jgi:hypothetical protein
MGDDMIECIRSRRPLALLLLAYYAPLLKTIQNFSFVEGWAEHIIRQVKDYLPADKDAYMHWPMEVTGMLLTIPDEDSPAGEASHSRVSRGPNGMSPADGMEIDSAEVDSLFSANETRSRVTPQVEAVNGSARSGESPHVEEISRGSTAGSGEAGREVRVKSEPQPEPDQYDEIPEAIPPPDGLRLGERPEATQQAENALATEAERESREGTAEGLSLENQGPPGEVSGSPLVDGAAKPAPDEWDFGAESTTSEEP